MKLKLDENLGHTSADLFQLAGHDVEMVQGEGLSGASDAARTSLQPANGKSVA